MNSVQKGQFDALMESMLDTGLAWTLENSLRVFWGFQKKPGESSSTLTGVRSSTNLA